MPAKKAGPVKSKFTPEERFARKLVQLDRLKGKGWEPPKEKSDAGD